MTNPREFAALSHGLAERLLHTIGPKSPFAQGATTEQPVVESPAKSNGHPAKQSKRKNNSSR
jgi:hypothetical protein